MGISFRKEAIGTAEDSRIGRQMILLGIAAICAAVGTSFITESNVLSQEHPENFIPPTLLLLGGASIVLGIGQLTFALGRSKWRKSEEGGAIRSGVAKLNRIRSSLRGRQDQPSGIDDQD